MVASVAHNHEVVGSIPTSAPKKTRISPLIQIKMLYKMEEKIEKFATVNSELKIISYEEYCEAVQVIKQYKLQLETGLDKVTAEVGEIEKFANGNSERTFGEICNSVRLYHALQHYFSYELNLHFSWWDVFPIRELSKISISKFAKCRNVGIKTMQQLQFMCFDEGITLQP